MGQLLAVMTIITAAATVTTPGTFSLLFSVYAFSLPQSSTGENRGNPGFEFKSRLY